MSVRTVLRDVEALSAAGVPVYCERGRAGGLRLLPGFRTDVSALTHDEARALLSVVAAPSASALGLADDLASALRKITAAVPQTAAINLARRVLVDPGGWFDVSPPPLLDDVQHVVLDGRRARLRYRSRDAPRATVRTVDPYGLVAAAGFWYLAAQRVRPRRAASERDRPTEPVEGARRDEQARPRPAADGTRTSKKNSQVRFYHLHRIASVTALDEPAQVPPSFDLASAWAAARASWQAEQRPVEAVVEVRHDAVDLLHPTVAPQTPPDPDAVGWVRLPLTFFDLRHAVGVCVGMGPDLRVLAPDDLRSAVVDRHRAVLDLYR
ncbi:MAG: WYL domain-containing protein [Micrococcales bacterium]|nr:WYL domain-containing protein [Micrococcales bacterium]